MAWEELTSDELARLLRREVMDLSSDLRLKYDRYAVSPIRMEYSWDLAGQRVSKPIWVIARAGSVVAGYDDVEEEFGTGMVRHDGVLEDWGTYGERLQWTLLHFPEDYAGGQRLGDARPVT